MQDIELPVCSGSSSSQTSFQTPPSSSPENTSFFKSRLRGGGIVSFCGFVVCFFFYNTDTVSESNLPKNSWSFITNVHLLDVRASFCLGLIPFCSTLPSFPYYLSFCCQSFFTTFAYFFSYIFWV